VLLATVVGVSVATPSRPASRTPRSTCRASGERQRAWTLLLLGSVLGLVALAPALLGTGRAAAQETGTNSLQSITPQNGANLAASPDEIVLSFNQEIANDERVLVRLGCDDQPQDTGEEVIDPNGLVVTVAINTPVPRGACVITWRLFDEDGTTIVSGFSTFRVDADPVTVPPTTPDAGGTTPTTVVTVNPVPAADPDAPVTQGSSGGAEWLGRLLSTLGILALFGGLALIALGWPEGPEYVVTVRYLRSVWVIGLLGTVLYLIAFSARVGDVSFSAAVNPSEWLGLADAGWPGRGALLRLVFVAACGWVAIRPERIIDPATAMWGWGLPLGALVATALTRVEGPVAWIGVAIAFAHLLTSAVWFGGVAIVGRVVLAGPGEEDLVHATRAFSRISTKAMIAVVLTGVIQMARLVGNPFQSSHGQVLLLKVVAVAAMVAVALAARQQIAYRLDRAHEMTVPLADRFRRAFGAEAAIGVVVLAFSGWMLALTPANVDPLAGESYAVEVPFVDTTTGIEASVSIGPARVGMNGFKIEVEQPDEGITLLELRFIPPPGSAVRGYRQPIPLSGSGTAYLRAVEGLNFQAPGQWTVELVASTATGNLPGAQQTFQVDNSDGTPPVVPTAVSGTQPQVSVVVSAVQPPPDDASFVTTAPPVVSTLPPTSPP
jgi:putative copper export protein/methionine-rich copper-binding protein CopC